MRTKAAPTVYERNMNIDYLKAVAIILVIVGHCVQVGSGTDFFITGSYYDNVVYKTIYSFHMPLFMMISGYLFSFSAERNEPKTVIVKKLRTLILPLLVWTALFELIMLAIRIISGEAAFSKWSFISIYSGFVITCWFIWAVFWSSLFVLLARKLFKDNLIIYIIGIVATMFISDSIIRPETKFTFPFFIIGYFFNERNGEKRFAKAIESKYGIIASGILFVGMLLLYNKDCYIYTSGFCIFNDEPLRQLGIDVFRFATGLVGSIFVLLSFVKLKKYVFPKKESAFFAYIGKSSFGVYIIQMFAFTYLGTYAFSLIDRLTNGPNYALTAVESAALLGFCLSLVYLIRRSKLLDRLLLGGR